MLIRTIAALLVIASTALGQSERPNILFIAVDDLRPQIAAYGERQMVTPNIDLLASSGTLFERAYCQVPVCGASRASIMTGIPATRDRFVNYLTRADEDAPEIVTLPHWFRKHGYYTISNGKIFHHLDDATGAWSEKPFFPETGFRDWVTYEIVENGWRAPYEAGEVHDSLYTDSKIADKTIADLQRLAEQEKPFFIATGFIRPHLPFNAPKRYWDLYSEEDLDMVENPAPPEDAPEISFTRWGELRGYHGIPKKGPVDRETARELVHGYYAAVSYMDAQVGRLLDELDRLGLRENTIVILWGDHGYFLEDHGFWCKHAAYEKALRVPLLISAPGMPESIRRDELVAYLDVYPTLASLAGLPLPSHLVGRDLSALMKNERVDNWRDAVFSRWVAGESMRTDRYRYTEYYDDEDEMVARMLYDHIVDPEESVNIAERPENAALVGELSTKLREYLAQRK